MNTTANAVHRAWVARESYRAAVARYSVAYLSVRDALARLPLTLDVAQRLIQWQGRTT